MRRYPKLTLLLFITFASCADTEEQETGCPLEECREAIRAANYNKEKIREAGYGKCLPFSAMAKINWEKNCIGEGKILSCGEDTRYYGPAAFGQDIRLVYEDEEGTCWTGGPEKPAGWLPVNLDDSYTGQCTRRFDGILCKTREMQRVD